MLLPATYQAALLLMLLSMLCWGSWANTLKLCPGYRFQLFYWDYAIGVLLGALFLGLTAGSHGSVGLPFLSDIVESPLESMKMAALGGVVFNVANLLLVAAIDIAGLAVAFPVGIGLALVVGSVWSYLVNPKANPILLFGGVALVTVAIVLDAAAYRAREKRSKATSTRGIVLSLIAGVLMGSFYPLVARAMQGERGNPGPGPYAIATFFAVGVLLSTSTGELDPDVEAAGRQTARAWIRLLGCLVALAFCRNPRRHDLVCWRGCELSWLRGTQGRAGRFLFNRARRNHDFGMLGHLCVARICRFPT
jgi:glucose uptake protein